MEEEQSSQPKRQRKITEYTQMHQQKHGGTPKAVGDGGNKAPGMEGVDEEIVGVAIRNASKTPPSQDVAPSL